MHLNVSQQMRMSQQMKLAPRMIQSMEILQLPTLALEERIDQEMEENPVLERAASLKDEPTAEASQNGEISSEDIGRQELVSDESNNASDFERLVEISKERPDDNYI